jgi:hypothetical protein
MLAGWPWLIQCPLSQQLCSCSWGVQQDASFCAGQLALLRTSRLCDPRLMHQPVSGTAVILEEYAYPDPMLCCRNVIHVNKSLFWKRSVQVNEYMTNLRSLVSGSRLPTPVHGTQLSQQTLTVTSRRANVAYRRSDHYSCRVLRV